MTQATNPIPVSQCCRLMTVVAGVFFAVWGRAQTHAELEKANTALEEGNAVERYAVGWEERFVLKDYEPADTLGKELHAYFKKLFTALGSAAGGDPRDISRIVGVARESLTEETARMIDTFVDAGYSRMDAEHYFDRLYPRLQLELARHFVLEQANQPRLLKPEDSAVSDGLLVKADELFYDKKDQIGALKALEDALKFAPANVRLILEAALHQQKFGRSGEARANFDLARQLYPKLVDIYFASGNVRVVARDYYGAIEDLTTAIYLQPAAVRAYAIRGDARMHLGDFKGAIDDYGMQIASGGRPGLGAVYHRRAQAHLALGNVAIAQADVEAAIHAEPGHAADYRTLGLIHHRRGNYGAAVTAFGKAIELKPDYAAAYAARIWSRLELGSVEAALADATRIIELEPTNARHRLIRAVVLDVLGRRENAESAYREAMKQAEENRDTMSWYYTCFHLDIHLRRQGSVEQDYFDDVLSWPDDWPKRIALHLSGRITAESLIKDSRHASTWRQQVSQKCEAYYYSGMLAWVTGDKGAALANLKIAAEASFTGNLEHTLARMMLSNGQHRQN